MIICGVCGARNDDGVTFCGTCGRYLDFVGAPDARPAQTEPEPAKEAAPSVAASQSAAAGPAGVDPTPLVVPVEAAAPEPAVAPAAPVLPGAPGPKRRTAELPPEEREVEPGELICGHCGAGNVPTRRFCRRCGTDLVDAPVAPPPVWWRRLLRSGRAQQPWAGDRPRRVVRRSYRGKVVFLVVLSLLAAAGWTQRGPITRLAAAVIDRVGDTRRVTPADLTVSSFAVGHGPALLWDGNTDTFWASARPMPHIDVRFRTPIRLVAVLVFNGASRDPQKFLARGRPDTLRFTFTSAGGVQTTRDVELKDDPAKQTLYLGVDEVKRLRITIVDTVGVRARGSVALGELEFYER